MGEPTAEDLDLDRPMRIHVVFVGGKAMSAMAEILVALGHRVSGSDPLEVPVLDRLRGLGVEVAVGADPAAVGDIDLVARSSAVPDDHPEVVAARQRGIPVVGRPVLQGAIARTRPTVAVSGTHGKTSTTAMLVHVLDACGRQPSYIVGGDLGGAAGGARWGEGGWFVVEGDESDGTFLELGAARVVVTNVEADHLDHYGTLDAIEDAFDRFLAQADPEGRLVCADDPIAARLGDRHGAVTYGTGPDVAWRLDDITSDGPTVSFTLVHDGAVAGRVEVPAPGRHNALNAAAAIAAAAGLGVPVHDAIVAIAGYRGVGRRFETRGREAEVTVVDDYAHNPGKVRAVVEAAGAAGWSRVVVVFQPHRVSRTADLWREFADSFVGADVVVVTDIFPAGEEARPDVTGHLVVDAVTAAHPDVDVRWVPVFDDLVPRLSDILRPGDLCLTLGAGDITRLADELLPALRSRGEAGR